jgi:hypothetical protein
MKAVRQQASPLSFLTITKPKEEEEEINSTDNFACLKENTNYIMRERRKKRQTIGNRCRRR